MTLQEHLKSIGACEEARVWAEGKTAKEAWEQCERVDWLFWWAGRTEKNKKTDTVLAACKIARTVLKFVPEGELRPLQAIEAAERYATDPSEGNRIAARVAAYATDAAYAAAYATDAAAYATAAAAYATASRYCQQSLNLKISRETLSQPWSEED